MLLEVVAENTTHGLVRLPLGERGPGSWTLKTPLPPGRPLTQVVALTVAVGPLTAHQIAHGEAEGETAVVPSGSAALGPLLAIAPGRPDLGRDRLGGLARPRRRRARLRDAGAPDLLVHEPARRWSSGDRSRPTGTR